MRFSLLVANSVIVAGMFCQPTVGSNIAGNPSFEVAGDSSVDAERWFGHSQGGMAERTSFDANSGVWSFYLSTTNIGSSTGVASLVQDNLPSSSGLVFPSLQELTEISASFWTNHNRATGELGRAKIQLLNSAGSIILERGIAMQDTGGQWVEHVIDPIEVPAFGPSPSDAYYYQILFSVDSENSPNSFIEAYIDDVVVEATFVPESMPMSLPVLAFISLLIKRRIGQHEVE